MPRLCCWEHSKNPHRLLLLIFRRGPEKPQVDAAPLTLAGDAHSVVAPEGLCPAGQARGASPVFRLAGGAAQLPADQGLDVLDCGRRWEAPSHAVEPCCGCQSVRGLGTQAREACRASVMVFESPDMGLEPPDPRVP